MSYSQDFLQFCAHIPYKPTSLRKHVLYILWQASKPLKAYDILATLKATSKTAKPAAVYRVLDYFVSLGVIHKIDSIQSFKLCETHQQSLANEILLVCDQCHNVQEIYDKNSLISLHKLTHSQQFQLNHEAIELKGLCASCQTSGGV